MMEVTTFGDECPRYIPAGMTYRPLPEPVPQGRAMPIIHCAYCGRSYLVVKAPATCEGCGAPLGVDDVMRRNSEVPSGIITLPRQEGQTAADSALAVVICAMFWAAIIASVFWAFTHH